MAVDYYIGQTVQELEVLLRSCQERKARGNISQVSGAGITTTRDVSKQHLEREIFNIRYSLWLRDPDNWADPRLERITRTRTRYL